MNLDVFRMSQIQETINDLLVAHFQADFIKCTAYAIDSIHQHQLATLTDSNGASGCNFKQRGKWKSALLDGCRVQVNSDRFETFKGMSKQPRTIEDQNQLPFLNYKKWR